MNAQALSVSQLNMYVRSLLEGDENLRDVFVAGEISNLKKHYSGHIYFSLKDSGGTVRCVIFSTVAQRIKFSIEDNMSVICRGRISLYERDGQYQFYINDLQPLGLGGLMIAFNKLKERLQKEGLFDESKKRDIPKFPKKIAVLTSATGAAIHDILTVTERRYPLCEIVFLPVLVQGDGAPESIIGALKSVYKLKDIDTIILGRGGGSVEDLWAFNDEELVRTVAASPIPIVSAVGHESDFTLCDFAADLRAPTPSAAAEMAVPNTSDILSLVGGYSERMKYSLNGSLNLNAARLAEINSSYILKNPERIYEPFFERSDRLTEKLLGAFSNIFNKNCTDFSNLCDKLSILSPLSALGRGYSITFDDNGKVISDIKNIRVGEKISVKFKDGSADCTVTSVKDGK